MPKNSQGKSKSEKPVKLGAYGILLLTLGVIIISGIIILFNMVSNFNNAKSDQSTKTEGLVTVTGDFAPHMAKPDDVLFRLAGDARPSRDIFAELALSYMKTKGYSLVNKSENDSIITISGSLNGRNKKILIALASSQGGFEAMLQKRVEGVISGRTIAIAEIDKLSAVGDMTSPQNAKIVAHDIGYVFVNNSNSISTISGDLLAQIFSGEVTDWSSISDNESGVINIKAAEEIKQNYGSIGAVIGDKEIIEGAKLYKTAQEVANSVASDSSAIGFAHFSQKPPSNVKILAVRERNARLFDPSDFNIATEAYPFTDRVSLFIAGNEDNPALKEFADYTISSEAQNNIKKIGYGAQILNSETVAASPDAPTFYSDFAKQNKRMNFDIRFKDGTNEFDNKALEDIKRFRDFIKANNIESKQIAIFGFADNVGARETNVGLSQSRAEKAVAELNKLGINPPLVKAMGEVMPVGANSLEIGRIKNRRVEIWICPPPSCPLINFSEIGLSKSSSNNGIPQGVRLGPPPKLKEGEESPKG